MPNITGIEMLFAAVHKSAYDAVDGSSTGTTVPQKWALLEAPTIGGATHANISTNSVWRHRQVDFSGSWRSC